MFVFIIIVLFYFILTSYLFYISTTKKASGFLVFLKDVLQLN